MLQSTDTYWAALQTYDREHCDVNNFWIGFNNLLEYILVKITIALWGAEIIALLLFLVAFWFKFPKVAAYLFGLSKICLVGAYIALTLFLLSNVTDDPPPPYYLTVVSSGFIVNMITVGTTVLCFSCRI